MRESNHKLHGDHELDSKLLAFAIERLTDAWVSLTDLDGEVWLRSVAANPGADPQYVFDRVVAAL